MNVRPWKPIDMGTLGAARATLEPLVRQLNPVLQDLASAASHNLSLADNLACSVRSIDVTVPDDWSYVGSAGSGSAIIWQNGWSNYGAAPRPVAVRKTVDGRVQMTGLGQGGTAPSVQVFTLPKSYWPQNPVLGAATSNGAFGSWFVDASGNVRADVGSATWFGFESVSYMAADRAPIPAACWPQTLAWDFAGPCIGVVCLSAFALDPANKGVPLSGVSVFSGLPSWQQTAQGGKRAVTILSVPGLAPGRAYRLTFALFAG